MSPLRQKAERLHQVLDEQFFDPQGLMYSYLNIETRKPFTLAEVTGYPIKFPGAPPLHDWFSHENTDVVAGNYLSALCHRARVEPGAETNARIERVLHCLRQVYDMSARVKEPGWLCKPYGGKPSNESTNDQYGGAIGGLRELARLPVHPLAAEARRLAVSLCDFWLRHDYDCPSYGRPAARWMGPNQWGLVSMAFIRVAYQLTGDDKYARETERACREEKCDQAEPRSGSFLKNPFPDRPNIGVRKLAAYHHLVAEYLDALCDAWPERREHWQQLLREFWNKDINMGLDDDGLLFGCYEVDLTTNQWRPVASTGYLFVDGATRETVQFLHHHWIGGFKAGSITCQVASSAVKVGRCVPALREECRAVAHKVLTAMDETKMTFVIDPTGKEASPEAGHVHRKMFDGRGPAQWLRAYWQGRELGWWE